MMLWLDSLNISFLRSLDSILQVFLCIAANCNKHAGRLKKEPARGTEQSGKVPAVIICFAMLVFISNFAAEKMIHGEIKYEGLSVSSV